MKTAWPLPPLLVPLLPQLFLPSTTHTQLGRHRPIWTAPTLIYLYLSCCCCLFRLLLPIRLWLHGAQDHRRPAELLSTHPEYIFYILHCSTLASLSQLETLVFILRWCVKNRSKATKCVCHKTLITKSQSHAYALNFTILFLIQRSTKRNLLNAKHFKKVRTRQGCSWCFPC